MLIAHRIELDTTVAVRTYFALAEWNRQYDAGQKPNAMSFKEQFNAIKYPQFPWLEAIHRDAHAPPFGNLGKAWNKFFSDIKAEARTAPDNRREKNRLKKRFKKEGKSVDSFYVANDKINVVKDRIKLPKIGVVRMTEAVRLGVDLNTGSIDLSNGVSIIPPKPLKALGGQMERLQKKASHKREAAKGAARIPKNQAIVVENLNVQGMTASRRGDANNPGKKVRQKAGLNRSMRDVGFGAFRRQMKYKSLMYGTERVMADSFFPSSQLCSTPSCDFRNKDLTLKDRSWTCPQCAATHDRDQNAAKNLEQYLPQAMREFTSVYVCQRESGHEWASKDAQGRN